MFCQIALLIPMSEEFHTEDFCTGLFDEFLFAGLTRDNVTRHMLKLLWYVHSRLPAARLATLMKALHPTPQHNESVHALYSSLQDRIGTAAAMLDAAAAASGGIGGVDGMDVDFDSPLKNMPTPGPHTPYM